MNRERFADLLSGFIGKGLTVLLVFTPLAFGTVHAWSTAIMEIMAFVLFGAWLLRHACQERFVVSFSPVIILAALFIVLVLIQTIVLPRSVVSAISPGTVQIYDEFGSDTIRSWMPLSIHQQATREELFKLIAYLAVFIVVVHHIQTREQVRAIVRTIIMLGLFMSVFAIVQKMTWNGRLYWFYPVDQQIISNRDYIWGPYLNHNHLAGYLEMAILLAFGPLFYYVSRQRSQGALSRLENFLGSSRSERFPKKAGLFIIIIIMIAILFATLSRGGIIGLTTGLLVFTLMIKARRSLKGSVPVLFFLGTVVLLVVVAASWDRIESRFGEIGDEGRIKRFDVWSDAIDMVQAFPLLGSGLGTFGDSYPLFQTKHSTYRFEHAENDYVEFLTDTGLVGFCIIVAIGVIFFVGAVRRWRKQGSMFVKCMAAGGLASCATIAMHSMTDFNLRVPANALLLTVIAGLTWAMLYNIGPKNASQRTHGRI